jgi:murein DD-endopeptidase MepM/ murein hydrolase activator NlpD
MRLSGMPLIETDEPTPEYLADTGQVKALRPIPAWRRAVGFLCLLGALGLTAATAYLVFSPPDAPAPAPNLNTEATLPPTATLPATTIAEVAPTVAGDTVAALPTLAPEQISALLSTPIAPLTSDTGLEIVRSDLSAFTILPDRPRSEVIQYTVQSGDTIFAIATLYGLQPETIAWSNPRSIITGLRPGRDINIPPVDGAYITVANERTIASIAQDYSVDPYAIIDSEYNDLPLDAAPDTLLPSGTDVMIPGGQAEQISWTPRVERTGGDNESGSGVGAKISFAPGDPGSCGLVDNPGGGGGWVRPVGSYSWSQGYSSYHTGVDLSAAEGTPVYAANGGTVVFRGWSTWGYGYLIVLAHGPFTTIYGHLSGINVGCGQYVSAGQQIGAVGNTGNSSGPHLHFEIRYNDVPFDPASTMPF